MTVPIPRRCRRCGVLGIYHRAAKGWAPCKTKDVRQFEVNQRKGDRERATLARVLRDF